MANLMRLDGVFFVMSLISLPVPVHWQCKEVRAMVNKTVSWGVTAHTYTYNLLLVIIDMKEGG